MPFHSAYHNNLKNQPCLVLELRRKESRCHHWQSRMGKIPWISGDNRVQPRNRCTSYLQIILKIASW